MSRKLFVSFGVLFNRVYYGKVSDDELNAALFALDRTRAEVFTPWEDQLGDKYGAVPQMFKRDATRGAEANRMLLAALEKAEAERRVVYLPVGFLEREVELLRANGFDGEDEDMAWALDNVRGGLSETRSRALGVVASVLPDNSSEIVR
jgi:hypothetical protein